MSMSKIEEIDSYDVIEDNNVVLPFPVLNRNSSRKQSADGGNGHGPTCVMVTRIESIEKGAVALQSDVAYIKTVLGESPDPIANTEGSGMSSLLFRIANAVVKDRQAFNSYPEPHEISMMPTARMSMVPVPLGFDLSEGDVTKIQDRSDLLARAKLAEAGKDSAEKALSVYREARIDSKHELEATTAKFTEISKIHIEKWKVAAAILGILLGPGVINILFNKIPDIFKLLIGN